MYGTMALFVLALLVGIVFCIRAGRANVVDASSSNAEAGRVEEGDSEGRRPEDVERPRRKQRTKREGETAR